jgi:hypothetical protein
MSSNLLRFTDFVKQNIGATYLEIAEYFSVEIAQLANECNIDWESSKSKIAWDGQKNRSPNVNGITSADKGRIFIWAEANNYTQDSGSFTYPYLSFQNMRNTLAKPGRKFLALRLLYGKYEQYKQTRVVPTRPNTPDPIALEKQQAVVQADAKRLAKHQRNVQVKETVLFEKMRSLSNAGVFSAYLHYDKKLQPVAEQFDIRLGKDKNGYFTAFVLRNIQGDFKALQRIYHAKPSTWDDNKRCTWGVDPTGLMTILGDINNTTSVIYICEGLATGLAMVLATGRPVAVCLNAYNMQFVSAEIAQMYPHIKRVHVADNDNDKPQFCNTGVHAAAVSVQKNGGWVFVPKIKSGTDVCDLYNSQGLDELKRQIYHTDSQYFNGRFSRNVSGMFNYIHDKYSDTIGQAP